jgi:hypothetical protein
MVEFEPIKKNPGEVIRSEDWNQIQDDIKGDLKGLEEGLQKLKKYIDNMQETTTLLDVRSLEGLSYNLDEVITGEKRSYETPIVGLLSKQWTLGKGLTGEICRFGIVTLVESIEYWAGAEKGDKKALEVVLDYMDGTNAVIGELFVHDRSKLKPKGPDNPYIDYLLTPNEFVWYKYMVVNPNPDKKVLTVSFRNTDVECTPRIGNVFHFNTKIRPPSE